MADKKDYRPWTRNFRYEHEVRVLDDLDRDRPFLRPARPVLPYGNGHTYGDVCQNDKGTLIDVSKWNRVMSFQESTGVLRCEAGLTLGEILRACSSRGWFLPVVPSTRDVTVGGAIANDIHGRNHPTCGTFGTHLRAFELLRSDGSRILANAKENSDLFGATIGGLGLTGIITWAELQLKPIRSTGIVVYERRFRGLTELFELRRTALEKKIEFQTVWIDGLRLANPEKIEGVFVTAEHSQDSSATPPECSARRTGLKAEFPEWAVNRMSVAILNRTYSLLPRGESKVPYPSFFYKLDAIEGWNRMLGPNGFYQCHFVIPEDSSHAWPEIFREIHLARQVPFLVILKTLGDLPSPGWLSFPIKGLCGVVDFANRGDKLRNLLHRLEGLIRQAGGRIYPAKDSTMSAESFQCFYPRWKELAKIKDPAFSSSFWRRVGGS